MRWWTDPDSPQDSPPNRVRVFGSSRCSGLRTVGDRLANSRISQPTIIANEQGSWLTIIANGPTLLCE